MAAIIARRKWTRQPQNFVDVDRSRFDPTWVSVAGADPFGLDGGAWLSNTGKRSDSVAGLGYKFDGSFNYAKSNLSAYGAYPLTIAAVFTPSLINAGSYNEVLNLVDGTNVSGGIYVILGIDSAGNIAGAARTITSGTQSSPTGLAAVAGVPYAAAVQLVARNNTRLYCNGACYYDTTDTGGINATFGQIGVGAAVNIAGASAAFFGGTVALAWYDHSRTFADHELLEWTLNPWSLFKSRTRRLYVAASAAATFNAAWNQAANSTISSGARLV